jgi:UDP-2,3-diacylglucosamine hydrolase
MKQIIPQLDSNHLKEAATYFISDLHLSDKTPEINESFYTFLKSVAPHADAIYILGDFLDAWVGDDTPAQFLPKLITACQKASEHTNLYFMQGNRDFLLSDEGLNELCMTRLADPTVITLYGKLISLCHGDHLCGRDIAHLIFRSVAQSFFFRNLFLSFSLSLRLKIAGQLRSEKHRQILHPPLVKYDVTKNRLQKIFEKNKTDTLIHGHTHRPRHHKHHLKSGKESHRWVLGAWDKTAVILRYTRNHFIELLRWDPNDFIHP